MPASSTSILNIDTDPVARCLRSRLFSGAGFETIDAAAAPEALDLAVAHRPAVIVVGRGIAGACRAEMTRLLKSQPPLTHSQILHIRAAAEPHDGVCHVEDSCLVEPVPTDLLLAHVRALARTHAALVDAMHRAEVAERRFHALSETEQRFRSMADGLPLIVWVHDAEGRQEFVNHRFCEFFGVAREEMRDGRWQALMHPDDADLYKNEFFACVRDRRPFHARVRVRRADGDWRWIESWARPRKSMSSDFLGFVGASADITDAVKSEQALRRSNEELQQFAYAVSHDLQEPLRGVTVCAELLQRRLGYKEDCSEAQLLRTIIHSGKRMSLLLRDLLSYSRLDRSEPRSQSIADINAVVEFAVANLSEAVVESKAIITWDSMPAVAGDTTTLAQVFQNLIGNALKYRSADSPTIHVSAERTADGHWTFSVKDNGIGIDPQYHVKIFGLFKRLHSQEIPGSGIGLALCRKVIERHGGRIWVESRPGHGSTFRFTLPAADREPVPQSAPES